MKNSNKRPSVVAFCLVHSHFLAKRFVPQLLLVMNEG